MSRFHPTEPLEAASAVGSGLAAVNKATLTGYVTAAVTSFISNPIAITSLLLALLGTLGTMYYNARRDRRESAREAREAEQRAEDRAEHLARMRRLVTQPAPLE